MNANSSSATKQDAKIYLGSHIFKGMTIYTKVTNVSRSGMSRSINMFYVEDGQILSLDFWASKLLGRNIDNKNGGLICRGAGMDMGFELVYNLSMAMFCPDKYDHDAAYSLKQQWL